MGRLFVPTMYPLVDPDTGLVTAQWRRYQEGVATAVSPGGVNEVLTSNGASLIWQKILNGNIGAAAAIDWTKVSKAGSSIADLATRSATSIDSGTLNAARLPTLSSAFLEGRTTGTVLAGVTTYLGLWDSTTESDTYWVIPLAGVVRNLVVVVDGAAGVGESFTYTARKNGADQTLTCAISGAAATSGSDVANSFAVAALDKVTIKLVTSGGATPRKHQLAVEVATA